MIVTVRHSLNTGNTPAVLANGELALNAIDQLLYYKHANGAVVILANGASLLTFTAAQVSSNLNQLPANTSPYVVPFNNNEILIGTSHAAGNTRVLVLSDGWYEIVTLGLVYRTGGGATPRRTDYWFRKNGVDIPRSAIRAHLGLVNVAEQMVHRVALRLVANDYVELVQAIDTVGIGMGLYSPSTLAGGPEIPSVSLTITKIAN